MSESPFPLDSEPVDPNLPAGRAPTLLKVAAILNLVFAGLEVIYGAVMLLSALMIQTGMVTQATLAEEAAKSPFGAGPPLPLGFMEAIATVIGVLPMLSAVLKIIGGVKILRRSAGAWGWGLAMGIVGCVQLWCTYFCPISLGVGIFTLIVVSRREARQYLAERPVGAGGAAGAGGAG